MLYLLAIPKWLAPPGAIRNRVRLLLARIAENWISVNNGILSLYRQPEWRTEVPAGLDRDGCYLVSCNHRSWVDILILQRCFNRRLPLLRPSIGALFGLAERSAAGWLRLFHSSPSSKSSILNY